MESLTAAALLLLPACGGVAILDKSLDATIDDATLDAADSANDVADDFGPDIDLGLPRCQTQTDCFFGQWCQYGWCCAGVIHDNACWCGNGAGCTIGYRCCGPADARTCDASCQ